LEADTVQFKKKRDPERFEQAKIDITKLITQAQAGDIELAYVDESGFMPQPLIVTRGPSPEKHTQ
jgi:hypothetical protein